LLSDFDARHSDRILAFLGRLPAATRDSEAQLQPWAKVSTTRSPLGGRRRVHLLVTLRSRSRHPCVALQVPEQLPEEPRPRHVPLPRPSRRRPEPTALWPLDETLTLTWPDFDTRPDTLTAPPPR
jgi:hypothetical protein